MSTVPEIEVGEFGTMSDGSQISEFTLKNCSGTEVKIINYGAIITSIKTKDKNGFFDNIVLGFCSLESYLFAPWYFGAVIGRFGNRIANGRFDIDGKTYQLATNDGSNHLHGGVQGFDKKVWNAKPFKTQDGLGLELTLLSDDGDQGYPGNMVVKVNYILTDNNELITEYHATTDKKTPVNLTQHTYFNLLGSRTTSSASSSTVTHHLIYIDADFYTPTDKSLIPTGEFRSVAATPFDFRVQRPIGERINSADLQLQYGLGYDHNFVLNKKKEKGFEKAAIVIDPVSGRVLEVWTEEPGIQFYSGNFLDGSLSDGERTYVQHSGFCLEPQHFPDSPNLDAFPSVILSPSEVYQTRMSFKFSTIDS